MDSILIAITTIVTVGIIGALLVGVLVVLLYVTGTVLGWLMWLLYPALECKERIKQSKTKKELHAITQQHKHDKRNNGEF